MRGFVREASGETIRSRQQPRAESLPTTASLVKLALILFRVPAVAARQASEKSYNWLVSRQSALTPHRQAMRQRLRQTCRSHALLHQAYFIRNAPKFHHVIR